MRILIVTQYYLPETGAPQNRLSGLAEEFIRSGVEVEVLTAMPNYPAMKIHDGYRGKFKFMEMINGVRVHRSWIFVSKNKNIFFRLMNYFSFVKTSWLVSFGIKGEFDFVICESPPLFLGISAQLISRRKKAGFIFNVSDLWPESAEKLGLVTNRFFLNLAYKLEGWLYRKSVLVSGQTKGICKDIEKRFPKVKTHWLPNGIDAGRFNAITNSDWRKQNNYNDNDFILLYAGIIGYAQGLDCIIKCAEKLKSHPEIKFVLLGDGPEKERLQKLSGQLKTNNVRFFASVSRNEMPGIISSTDAAVIPLRKLELFTGAIPSKIFENLAMKKPLLLGVEGEAKELFIDQGKCGLFFEPENSDDLAAKVMQLKNDPVLRTQLGENGSEFVNKYFNRKNIASDFLKVLNSIMSKGR